MAAWGLLLLLTRISLIRGESFLFLEGWQGMETEGEGMGRLRRWRGIESGANTLACSIEVWALEEAKRRLQAEGTLPEDS